MKNLGIAIPTYNRQDQLGTLLEAIPKQYQIYVSDNGRYLSELFRGRFPLVHFKELAGEPVKMFANWNLAARMVNEDWVVIPSDDDIYFEKSFEIISDYLDRYKTADVVIFGHQTVDGNYQKINEWKPQELVECEAPNGFEYFKYGVFARMPSIFFKRNLLEELGYFDEYFKITAADSDLVQRALIKGRSVFVPEVVSGYRVWLGGATHNTIGTVEWMSDVDYWGRKIEEILHEIPKYSKEASTIRSEIYALNLFAGVVSAKRSGGYSSAWIHFKNCSYPYRARLQTQLRLLSWLIRP
ncbi:MAG: glycosyltransferase family 2 protein [Sideroxydans sp.]|nr:glycosyltransferase family 2 protein [Sideroxydans sp.]